MAELMAVDNANPVVFQVAKQRPVTAEEEKDDVYDEIDTREVFGEFWWSINYLPVDDCIDLIRHINDPEHPLTLEELNVVQEDLICINNKENSVSVHFTPTIPHCSMATLIGLSIRVCLLRSLPNRFKIDVIITPGSHMSEQAINKQLADKERIAAAIENSHLLNVVHQCLNTKRKQ